MIKVLNKNHYLDFSLEELTISDGKNKESITLSAKNREELAVALFKAFSQKTEITVFLGEEYRVKIKYLRNKEFAYTERLSLTFYIPLHSEEEEYIIRLSIPKDNLLELITILKSEG